MILKTVLCYLLLALMLPVTSSAGDKVVKKVEMRKTQKVDFDGSDVDGQIRSPDGSLMIEKRGVQFMPLYKVNNQAEKNILESVEYLR
jgi:hypothetical protein